MEPVPLISRDLKVSVREENVAFLPPGVYRPPSLQDDENFMKQNVLDPLVSSNAGVVDHLMSVDASCGFSASNDQGVNCGVALEGVSGDAVPHSVARVGEGQSDIAAGENTVVSSSTMFFQDDQPLIRNEQKDTHWNQEQGTSGEGIGGPSRQQMNAANEEIRKELVEDGAEALSNSAAETPTTTAKPEPGVSKADAPLISPSSQTEMSFVIKSLPQQPAAVSVLKHRNCETYSSDDDDVFLPNPPSKSQADKCIVAMITDEEVCPPSIAINAASAGDVALGNKDVVAMETPCEEESREDETKGIFFEADKNLADEGRVCVFIMRYG